MVRDSVDFHVTRLEARVPPGIPVVWRDRETSTGPLVFVLDDEAGRSGGTMDYSNNTVSVEFRVRVRSPELEALFGILGFNPGAMLPIRAVLRAQGEILSDHSFIGGLRGSCVIRPHSVFWPDEIHVAVLPGL